MTDSKEFTGSIAESSDNKTYTDNIKETLGLFENVETLISNLKKDSNSVLSYLDKLKTLKTRGFKVDNSIARLQFQYEQTIVVIDNLHKQRSNRYNLIKQDILELAERVLNDRLIIDDKEKERVQKFRQEIDEYRDIKETDKGVIDKLVTMSLNHMKDLHSDVKKFDVQIEEAMVYASSNYDIGDLSGDLLAQKDSLKKSYDIYNGSFVLVSTRHLARTKKYIEELKEEAKKIKDIPKEDLEKTPLTPSTESDQSLNDY